MKKCTICGVQKPLSEFQKRKESKDGHRNECVPCRNVYNASWHLKNKYNISQSDFLVMLKNQNSTCGICFNPLKLGTGTHVDHCHTTGKIRGLLCNSCNRGIGYLQDSLEIIKSAQTYLEKYK